MGTSVTFESWNVEDPEPNYLCYLRLKITFIVLFWVWPKILLSGMIFLGKYKQSPDFYHPKGENVVREHLWTVFLLCSKWPTWCFQKYVWTYPHLWFFFCSVIKLHATITLLEPGIWDELHLCPCELLKFNANNSILPLNSSWENFRFGFQF